MTTPTQLREALRAAGWATCAQLPAGAKVEEFESPSGVAVLVPLADDREVDQLRMRAALAFAKSHGVEVGNGG